MTSCASCTSNIFVNDDHTATLTTKCPLKKMDTFSNDSFYLKSCVTLVKE